MSAFFKLVAQNFWAVTALLLAASVGTAFIGDYQAMAILACCFGGMLMWEAERHNAPQALAPDEALAEPAR